MTYIKFAHRNGILRAHATPGYELLAAYFEADIQTAHSCQVLLKDIEDFEQSDEECFEETGNAFTATIFRDRVVIEANYGGTVPHPLVISLKEFKETLHQCVRFVLDDLAG